VEIHAEGSLTSLDAYVSWLRKGPPGARVDALRSRSAAPSGLYLRFSIEH
jgi:acylphosphatase